MRPYTGAPPLTCRSEFEIVLVFPGNDLLALMLNVSRRGGFLPPRQRVGHARRNHPAPRVGLG